MTSRLSFISLKWKTFLLLSLALSLIFVAEFFYVSNNLKNDFYQEKQNLAHKYLNEIDLLSRQYKNRLELMSTGMLRFSNIHTHISTKHFKRFQKELNIIWPTMENNYQLSSGIFVDTKKEFIAQSGNKEIKIIDSYFKESVRIQCDISCIIYFIIPAYANETLIGHIQFTTDIDWLIKQFNHHTDVQIGLTKLETHKQNTNLDNKIIKGEILLGENHETYYLSTVEDHYDNLYWSFTKNISEIIEKQNDFKYKSIFFIILKLLLCQICLFLALWRPLTRLKNVTQYLPKLASNYDDFIAHYAKKNRRIPFPDESNIIQLSALHLAKRLRFLNEKVEKRQAELERQSKKNRQDKKFTNTLLNTAQAIILTLDDKGHILLANNYTYKITGYSRKDLINKPLKTLLNKEEDQEKFDLFIDTMNNGHKDTMQFQYDIRSKSGELIHMAWYNSVLDSDDHHQIITVGIDISDRKRVEEHLGWLASIDPLTNLYNRRRFTEELENVIAASHRYNHTSAVLFFDLDNFKDVNDLSGHHTGDELLKKVAQVLNINARESDMVARLGGDEFAIIIKETNREDALACAQRFCRKLNSIEIQMDKHAHKVSSSIGIALYPDHGSDIKTLLANADSAMYKAKELGRNRVFLFDNTKVSEKKIQKRVYWNQKAQELIASENVIMHYQPIWNLKTNEISHYEALLRIPVDDQLLSPFELIQAAERNNIIYDIDLLVLRQVCKDIEHLAQHNIYPKININISGLSFQKQNLVTKICDFITEFQVDSSQLTCEITETAAAADVGVTTKVMEQLKSLGISMALDDFGVGFSSIYYLKHFPIDYIKIDGSFIKNLHQDKESQALVKAITQVANAFGQSTVAEFVEQEETVDKLIELGVTYAQGYYLSRPSSLTDCFKQLATDT